MAKLARICKGVLTGDLFTYMYSDTLPCDSGITNYIVMPEVVLNLIFQRYHFFKMLLHNVFLCLLLTFHDNNICRKFAILYVIAPRFPLRKKYGPVIEKLSYLWYNDTGKASV